MAQVTRAEFAAALETRIPDNTTKSITPTNHRAVDADLADSAVWHDEVGTAAGAAVEDFAPASHQHATADVADLAEYIRDTMATALTAGANVTITPDDAGETIAIAASGGGGGGGDMLAATYDPGGVAGDAFARDNHTGTQAIGTVTGLQGALDGKAASGHGHTLADISDAGTAAAEDATAFAPAAHASDTDNPHGVTAAQVGLGNADNTADADKPISTAQRAGLMATVNHGATAGTARPAGATAVYWIGSVAPTNAIDSDIWHDTGV